MNRLVAWRIDSPFGRLMLAEEGGELRLCVPERDAQTVGLRALWRPSPLIQEAEVQLTEFFLGKRRRFDLPLYTAGTEFQQSVRRALCEIPFGQLVTYSDVAEAVGLPTASMAVGTACSNNPLLIIVPCHRVVRADGSPGGYRGGQRMKQQLLEMERMRFLHLV